MAMSWQTTLFESCSQKRTLNGALRLGSQRDSAPSAARANSASSGLIAIAALWSGDCGGTCNRSNIDGDIRALLAQLAATALLASLLWLTLSAPVRAQACSSPNNSTCFVDESQTFENFSFFSNGDGAAGTVNNSGTFENSFYFSNGERAAGTINNSGTFENSDTFYNGEGAAGTVDNSGTFKNSGYFINSHFGAGTVDNSGTFDNSGNFINGDVVAGTVNNSGTFTNTGAIWGTGAFNNLLGGTFNTGGTMFFGTLTNAGAVVIAGGTGAIATQAMGGPYVQTPTGELRVRADWTGNDGAGAADRLAITGTASLAGSVVVDPINFPSQAGLTKTFTVLTATGGITDNGISVADTAAVNYELLYPDANTLNLQATINFQGVGIGGLSPNQNAVGGNLNAAFGGGTSLPFTSALTGLATNEELGTALDQLSPLGDGASFSTAMASSNTFASQLLSCRSLGEGDANAVIREGQCLWVRANARTTNSDGGTNAVGFDETATFYTAGAQVDLGGAWRLGGGIGFETTDLATDSNARSESDRLHLGAVVKYNPGPLLLAAGITAGHGWADNERRVSFGGFTETATSDTDLSFVTGRLTAAYLLPSGHWYAKPQIDLALTHLERDAYSEDGSGGIALNVREASDTVFSISPSLELGAQYALAFGGIARPYVKAGLTWMDQDRFATSASFAGAPASVAGFAVETEVDDLTADLGAGVDFISDTGTALRLQYDARVGDTTEQHAGSAKLSLPF